MVSGFFSHVDRAHVSALCPSDQGSQPWLHHPITLPCGHTLSASHITLPAVPPLTITSSLPHDIFAAQQKQHQQRLNLWAGVMCPIPTCKRYAPNASSTPMPDYSTFADESMHGAERDEVSGVAYYPPPPNPSTFTPEINDHPSSLLDISVEKVLNLVKQEINRRETVFTSIRETTATDTEDSDDEGPPRSGLSVDLSQLSHQVGGPTSPLARRSSKRRRNGMAPRNRSGSPDEWPFRKELASVVECDVCAMMLYEPVTTPCQHVSMTDGSYLLQSFCSKCLSRSLDHSSRCPLCRQDLPSFAFFQDHSVNRVLLTVSEYLVLFSVSPDHSQNGFSRRVCRAMSLDRAGRTGCTTRHAHFRLYACIPWHAYHSACFRTPISIDDPPLYRELKSEIRYGASCSRNRRRGSSRRDGLRNDARDPECADAARWSKHGRDGRNSSVQVARKG